MIDRRESPGPDPRNRAHPAGKQKQGGTGKGEARPGNGKKNRKDRSGWIGFAAATAFFTVLLGRMISAGPAAANTDWNAAGQAPSSPTVHAGSSQGQPGTGGASFGPGVPTPGSGGAGSLPDTAGPGASSGNPDGSGGWTIPGDSGQGSNPGFGPDYGSPQNPPGSYSPPDYGPPAMSPPVDGITGAS